MHRDFPEKPGNTKCVELNPPLRPPRFVRRRNRADGTFRPPGKRSGRNTPPAGRNPSPSGGRKLGAADGSSVRGTEAPSRRAPSGGRRPPSPGRSSAGRNIRPADGASVRRTEMGGTELPSRGRSFRPPDGIGFRPAGGSFRPRPGSRGEIRVRNYDFRLPPCGFRCVSLQRKRKKGKHGPEWRATSVAVARSDRATATEVGTAELFPGAELIPPRRAPSVTIGAWRTLGARAPNSRLAPIVTLGARAPNSRHAPIVTLGARAPNSRHAPIVTLGPSPRRFLQGRRAGGRGRRPRAGRGGSRAGPGVAKSA